MPETLGWKVDADQFRSWHFSDLLRCPQFGRYWGESRHGLNSPFGRELPNSDIGCALRQ
jgi:hypothetical protein